MMFEIERDIEIAALHSQSIYGSWHRDDPRDAINKRDNIIILRPSMSGHFWDAGTARVETKEGVVDNNLFPRLYLHR
jgi:hypothetical protein